MKTLFLCICILFSLSVLATENTETHFTAKISSYEQRLLAYEESTIVKLNIEKIQNNYNVVCAPGTTSTAEIDNPLYNRTSYKTSCSDKITIKITSSMKNLRGKDEGKVLFTLTNLSVKTTK